MNTFINELENDTNFALTENGALTHKTTMSNVYDLFAFGGAYRNRSHNDVVVLFKDAYLEDQDLALKCLFWLRDCRGGQGERRFFRIAYNWLAKNDPDTAIRLAEYVSEYGRWDDLIYTTIDTPIWSLVVDIIDKQLRLDLSCETPSLLAKWVPSENASSYKTKKAAKKLREGLRLSNREYRKMLSILRKKINIVERLMSENRWDEIEFDKIPSKAGLIYKNAFARRDIIAQKYKEFAESADTKVNADTLYPYEVVRQATQNWNYYSYKTIDKTDRAMINKYWENLPDYFNGQKANMLCVVDTSGSMTCANKGMVAPIDVAIGLGMYCAERLDGPFKNKYISFASRPQLIKIEGVDFVDKVRRIYDTNLVDDTDLSAVFDLLLNTAKSKKVKKEDIPQVITIISDMEINAGIKGYYRERGTSGRYKLVTEMEMIRKKWEKAGFTMPRLVYWNVNARNNNILDLGENVSYVSGCSPITFKQVITGKSGYDLMLEVLNNERYSVIYK